MNFFCWKHPTYLSSPVADYQTLNSWRTFLAERSRYKLLPSKNSRTIQMTAIATLAKSHILFHLCGTEWRMCVHIFTSFCFYYKLLNTFYTKVKDLKRRPPQNQRTLKWSLGLILFTLKMPLETVSISTAVACCLILFVTNYK